MAAVVTTILALAGLNLGAKGLRRHSLVASTGHLLRHSLLVICAPSDGFVVSSLQHRHQSAWPVSGKVHSPNSTGEGSHSSCCLSKRQCQSLSPRTGLPVFSSAFRCRIVCFWQCDGLRASAIGGHGLGIGTSAAKLPPVSQYSAVNCVSFSGYLATNAGGLPGAVPAR